MNGRVIIDLEGVELSAEEKELLLHPAVVGVTLFSRNYIELKQLAALTASIRRIRSPLVIAVDHEGGRVQRFIDGFTRLPSMQYWGDAFLKDANQAKQDLHAMTVTMAGELLQHGVNMSYAPVLDLDYGVSDIIGTRSFHSDPEIVSVLAECVIDAMHSQRMPVVGKHFPGHGGVAADSHLELPEDQRESDELLAKDIKPYQALISKLDAIMPAHVIYPRCDDMPAGFSRYWLEDILRKKLEYQGIVISDDLGMKAAVSYGSYSDRASIALEAGCDLLCMCNDRKGQIEVLENFETYKAAISDARIQRYINKLQ